ncbi:MAG: CBS domain-containing protein [Myxococcota bacterium]
MRVKDIMTPAPVCCTTDTPLDQVARMMVEHHCGCIPVVRDPESRHLVGVVTDRDIVCRALAQGVNPLEVGVQECMTSAPLITTTPEATLGECLAAMERHLLRRLPVVDPNGNCVGIVAQADVVRAAPQADAAEMVRTVSQPTEESARIH